MALYTTDDINFHGFLAARRQMQGKPLTQVGRGLYSKPMLARIESGERLPGKLERDRMVERLGVSGDRYEDYLPLNDYEWWTQRQEIVKAVEAKDWSFVETKLEEYKGKRRRSRVEKQFLQAMRFMMMQGMEAADEELHAVMEEAFHYTVPNIKQRFPKHLLLAPQEINLFIEYVRYHRPTKAYTEAKWRKWKRAKYARISQYIDQSCMDNIGKAKVYPKLVYYICQEYSVEQKRLREIAYCLKLCNDAIELLRDTRRMYYLVELLELRQTYIAAILKIREEGLTDVNAEVEELQALAKISGEWEKMFKDLYKRYDVNPYMENFCYLYWETESYCINDVIRIRRKMLGLTQAELVDGICDVKTLRRTERKKRNAQMCEVREMFERLGLCPEYVRANVVTSDAEVMKVHEETVKYANNYDVDRWKEGVARLERELCLEIPQNKQAIERERILLELFLKEISNEECVEQLKVGLELTMPVDKIMESEEWYLTVEEISYLQSMAIRINPSADNVYIEILRKYCNEQILKNCVETRVGAHEQLITNLENYLGNLGLTDESNRLGEFMIKYDLKNRRMHTLAKNLYHICWNNYQIGDGKTLARDEEVLENLHKCILLSEIINDKKLHDFLKNKLDD